LISSAKDVQMPLNMMHGLQTEWRSCRIRPDSKIGISVHITTWLFVVLSSLILPSAYQLPRLVCIIILCVVFWKLKVSASRMTFAAATGGCLSWFEWVLFDNLWMDAEG
jgi:hypothetical protein